MTHLSYSQVAGGTVADVNANSTGLNPAWRDAIAHIRVGKTWPEGASSTDITQVQRSRHHVLSKLCPALPLLEWRVVAEHHPHQRRWVGCSSDPRSERRVESGRLQRTPCSSALVLALIVFLGCHVSSCRESVGNRLLDRNAEAAHPALRVQHLPNWVSSGRIQCERQYVALDLVRQQSILICVDL